MGGPRDPQLNTLASRLLSRVLETLVCLPTSSVFLRKQPTGKPIEFPKMHQRITYLLPPGTGVNPSDIDAGKDHLTFAKAHDAAVERRMTLGLSELPHYVCVHMCQRIFSQEQQND